MNNCQRLPDDLLTNLARIISEVEAEMLFQVSLDESSQVLDIECLASGTESKDSLPVDLLLERPRELGAASVLYISSGSARPPAQVDLDFTRDLIGAGARHQISVLDHYLVEAGAPCSLRSTTNLWN